MAGSSALVSGRRHADRVFLRIFSTPSRGVRLLDDLYGLEGESPRDYLRRYLTGRLECRGGEWIAPSASAPP